MKKLSVALMLACILAPASTRAQNAYITNQRSNTVTVIDTAANTISATIPVGVTPFGVAVSPNGSKVYVTNAFSNTVSVIDTATNTVIATIPVGITPACIPSPSPPTVATSPNASTNNLTNSSPTSLSMINTSPAVSSPTF